MHPLEWNRIELNRMNTLCYFHAAFLFFFFRGYLDVHSFLPPIVSPSLLFPALMMNRTPSTSFTTDLDPAINTTTTTAMTASPSNKLRQEVVFLKQKIDYQQKLLDSERKVTDELLANKNRAIESLQHRLSHQETSLRNELDHLQKKLTEVSFAPHRIRLDNSWFLDVMISVSPPPSFICTPLPCPPPSRHRSSISTPRP